MCTNFYFKKNLYLKLLRSITSINQANHYSKFLSLVFLMILQFCNLESHEIKSFEKFDFFKIEDMSKNRIYINQTRQVEIKGFLYKLEEETFILAAEPNLKSCCIGNSNKQHKQLIVYGDLLLKHLDSFSPITLRGVLVNNKQDSPLQLIKAVVVEEEKSGDFERTWTACIALIILGVYAIWKWTMDR